MRAATRTCSASSAPSPIAWRMWPANAARPAGGGSRWLGMAEYRPPISSSKLRRAV